MILAVEANVYAGMLTGLFIVALGFSLQQTAANPFAISLGNPKTGADRVNLGGGINSFGTTIGPLIVAFALFGTTATVTDDQIKHLDLNKVILLYVCVGLLFVAAAAMFRFSKKVPAGISNEPMEKANKAMRTLVIMTGLLAICFAPVFNSYKSDEALKIEKLEQQIATINAKVEEDKTITLSATEAAEIEAYEKEAATIKDGLEKSRMMWLSGAFFGSCRGSFVFISVRQKEQ